MWQKEVMKRLDSLDYRKHSFDHQLFYKVMHGEVVSILLVYVDDSIGIARSDYKISELHDLFKWGSLDFFEVEKPMVFKSSRVRNLLLTFNEKEKRHNMKISMSKFINGPELRPSRESKVEEGSSTFRIQSRRN